jgi:hypothetical protein
MGHPSSAEMWVVVIVDELANWVTILILYGWAERYKEGLVTGWPRTIIEALTPSCIDLLNCC